MEAEQRVMSPIRSAMLGAGARAYHADVVGVHTDRHPDRVGHSSDRTSAASLSLVAAEDC